MSDLRYQTTQGNNATWTPVSPTSPLPICSAYPGTAVNGIGTYAAAQTDTALVADPGAGLTIHVTRLIVTNDATHAITLFLETDTAGAKTAITPTYTIGVSQTVTLDFGPVGILCATHKNLGVTTTQVSNFTVQAIGYAA